MALKSLNTCYILACFRRTGVVVSDTLEAENIIRTFTLEILHRMHPNLDFP